MSPSVRLQDVSLCYRLAKQRIPSFKDYAIHWVKGALSYEKLWALRDIALEVQPGQILGIVGRNGAGKSTLLKVISGVLKPTTGRAEVNGRVAPILALGAGFDHELTGLENIYLNGLLLGHTRREIAVKVDEIIEFSDLGDFMQSPVRNYSSGMQARLGFSIATAWVPDILILDEVLAVGDVGFVRKCARRMESFRKAGSTILMSSHNEDEILTNCTRCIWIDAGRIVAEGAPETVVAAYLESMPSTPAEGNGATGSSSPEPLPAAPRRASPPGR